MKEPGLIDDIKIYVRAFERGMLLILMIAALGIRSMVTNEPLFL